MVSVSSTSILGIIVSVFVLVILIANAVYLNGVRSALSNPNTANQINLSKTGADIFFWIDIILAVLIAAYLIYCIWVIFASTSTATYVKQVVTKPLAQTTVVTTDVPTGNGGLTKRTVTTTTTPTEEL